MLYSATVTQKGQITLPKRVRDLLGIKSYEKVIIHLRKDYLTVKPAVDILSLAGTFKVKKGLSALKAREAMENNYKRV